MLKRVINSQSGLLFLYLLVVGLGIFLGLELLVVTGQVRFVPQCQEVCLAPLSETNSP